MVVEELDITEEVSVMGGVEFAEYSVRGDGLFERVVGIPVVCSGLSDLLSK